MFVQIGYLSTSSSITGFCQASGEKSWSFMNNFLPSLSPDAIDLSLCAMVVGDSDHNQAEATGISEKKGTTIIHYHRQASDNDEFLSWYGKFKKKHFV